MNFYCLDELKQAKDSPFPQTRHQGSKGNYNDCNNAKADQACSCGD